MRDRETARSHTSFESRGGAYERAGGHQANAFAVTNALNNQPYLGRRLTPPTVFTTSGYSSNAMNQQPLHTGRSSSVTHPPTHRTPGGRREYLRKRKPVPLPPIIDPMSTVKGGLFDEKRYGTNIRTMQAVPAAAGPPNMAKSDVLPDGRRITAGYAREPGMGCPWGGSRFENPMWTFDNTHGNRPPWSAAMTSNPWHGEPPHPQFYKQELTQANCFRKFPPPLDGPPPVATGHSTASGAKAYEVYERNLDLNRTVGHQYTPPVTTSKEGKDAAGLPLPVHRQLWRRPGENYGNGATENFWESQKGRVEQPTYATRAALFEERSRWVEALQYADIDGERRMHANIGGQEDIGDGKAFLNDYSVGTLNKGMDPRREKRGQHRLTQGTQNVHMQGEH